MDYYNENEGRGLGIAGLVLGIIGFIISCTPFLGILFGLVGTILCIIGLVRANKVNARKQLIIAGLVISIIASVLGTTFLLLYYQKLLHNIFEQVDNNRNNDNNFYDQNDKYNNFDSLKIDDEDIDNLNKSMNDTTNGPGSAPLN